MEEQSGRSWEWSGAFRRLATTALVVALGYSGYFLYMSNLAEWLQGIDVGLFPVFSLAVGLFIGYRSRSRAGWLYGGLPIFLLAALIAVTGSDAARYLWVAARLPVGLFCGLVGGFIGSRLPRTVEIQNKS